MKEKILEELKQFKVRSVFIRNLIIIVVLFAIPLWGITKLYLSKVNDVLKYEINSANMNTICRIKDITDALVSQTNILSIYMSQDDKFKSFVIKNPMHLGDWEELCVGINNEIRKTILSNSYIDSIYVVSDKTGLVLDGYALKNVNDINYKGWIKPYLNNSVFNNDIQFKPHYNGYPYFLTVANTTQLGNKTRLGIVIINIDIEKLIKMAKDSVIPSSQRTYIVDSSNKVIYSDDISNINKNIDEFDCLKNINKYASDSSFDVDINNETNILSLTGSNKYQWKFISLFPLANYNDKINNINTLMSIIILVLFFVVVVATFIISMITYLPIKHILFALKYPYEYINNYKMTKKDKYNEVSFIIKNIIQSAQKNKNTQEDLENKMMLLNRAQAVALQTQINPHFLYNTLETINWMAVKLTNEENDVSYTLDILSKLFRKTSDATNYIITVVEEIENTKLFIKILLARYKDVFEVRWDINEVFLNKKILKLILQPIVENAIYHGIRPSKKNGIIVIRFIQRDDKMIINVEDNGIGIDNDVLQGINDNLNKPAIFETEHIGLYNVNQRIKLIHGGSFGVNIKSVKGIGTKVEILLPIIE